MSIQITNLKKLLSYEVFIVRISFFHLGSDDPLQHKNSLFKWDDTSKGQLIST